MKRKNSGTTNLRAFLARDAAKKQSQQKSNRNKRVLFHLAMEDICN
jgi:hypothetical protein